MSTPIAIREATPSDMSFVLHSYLKSYREAPINKMISTQEYYKLQSNWVNSVILEPYSKILLAVNPESPDQIYGYIWYFHLADNTFAHWIYIKQPFRRFKLATALVAALPKTASNYYTHFNENFQLFKRYGAKYVPWYYFNKEEKK